MSGALPLVIASLKDVAGGKGPFDAGTALVGPGAVVDSMGLVALLADLEQKLESERGVAVTIADEKAFSQKSSPFRTVGSLAEYLDALLKEASRG